jgi:HEAT repeat protein
MTRPGITAIGAIILAGGLTKATPIICALPRPFVPAGSYVGPNHGPDQPAGQTTQHTPPPPTREDVDKAIDRLGAFDYDERMKAARAVRRAPGTVALPALLDAATGHADGFVRYRALVLLSGYDDPRVPDAMEQALGEVNDRLRTVGYQYFERHPDPRLVPAYLKAFDSEMAEFVRPALVRAMAAQGRDARLQPLLVKDVTRGQDFFRSTVIEALGDYKAEYALKPITDVAALDGPLRDDAVVALGKIGNKDSLGVLAGLQRTAPSEAQPSVATAICLLGTNCDSHRGFLARTLTFSDRNPGFQDLLRSAASGLGALAANGDVEAGRTLFEVGVPSTDPTRAPVALALAGFAVRRPSALLERLAERHDRQESLVLLREGFDMLEEDFAEEQFFTTVRKAYFAAADESPQKPMIQALINTLEF